MKGLTCGLATLALMVSATIASAQDDRLHQWVRMDNNGSVKGSVVIARNGSVSSLGDVQVWLVSRDSSEASDPVSTDETGTFVLEDVQPGIYNVIVRGEKAFACCALHVVLPNVPVSNEFEVAAGAVDYTVVHNAMLRYLPPGDPAEIDFDPTRGPLPAPQSSMEAVRISQTEGGLKGRLARAGQTKEIGSANANVMIFRGDTEVARTRTDADGNFRIDDLKPGSYTILGLGRDGVGVLGLELVDPTSLQTARADRGSTLVANQSDVAEMFTMQVAPLPPEATVTSDVVISEEEIGPGVPVDGYGAPIGGGGNIVGGGGGGGGGLGGGGGIGAFLGFGAIAAIALSDDDDDDDVTPPIASPSIPVLTP